LSLSEEDQRDERASYESEEGHPEEDVAKADTYVLPDEAIQKCEESAERFLGILV